MKTHKYLDSFTNLKHSNAIKEIFEEMFESWMDDSDKAEYITSICSAMNSSLTELDSQIEQGVKNGYSVKIQVAMFKKILKQL
jgi:CHASE3 domain sensor protein